MCFIVSLIKRVELGVAGSITEENYLKSYRRTDTHMHRAKTQKDPLTHTHSHTHSHKQSVKKMCNILEQTDKVVAQSALFIIMVVNT